VAAWTLNQEHCKNSNHYHQPRRYHDHLAVKFFEKVVYHTKCTLGLYSQCICYNPTELGGYTWTPKAKRQEIGRVKATCCCISAQDARNHTLTVHDLSIPGIWACGKRRGFSPVAATRHRGRTRVPKDLCILFYLALVLARAFSLYFFQRLWDRTSPCFEIGHWMSDLKKMRWETSDVQKSGKPQKKTVETLVRPL